MCLLCQEEAFYQAYLAYIARKQTGATGEASQFKAEAVDGTDDGATPPSEVSNQSELKPQNS